MHRQSSAYEQKPVTEETSRYSSLPIRTFTEQDTSLTKSPWRLSTKPSLINTHSEIKRREALSPLPVENYDEIIRIRSAAHHNINRHKRDHQRSIVTINVSGDRFQTYLSTLELYPNTLLGDENKRKFYWNEENHEYFFERNRACFEAILCYYQTNGRLRRPEYVPLDTFLEEITFFQLDDAAVDQVHQVENIKKVHQNPMPRALWRRYIWFYLEYPQHSIIARVINLVSMFFTIFSCISLAIESLPQYNNRWDNICKQEANISLDSTYVPRCSALFTSPFFIIQTICVAFFTIEFILRFITTPSYFHFILSFFNWVDLSAIVPYYVFLSIQLADQDIGLDASAILFIRILRILRFSRLFKIYLLFRRLKSLRVLSATIRESLIDFVVMITILTLLAFLFGAATYFAEQSANGDVFDSIPKATYWGIITVTGVGYGDMCPITAAGRVLTCLCALLGSATMGMLVSVLVDRYQRVYNRKMYVTEPELPPVDLDKTSDIDDDSRSIRSSTKIKRRKEFSTAISQRFSSFQEKIKNDRRSSTCFQFIVSFHDDDKEHIVTDYVVTTMKKKLTEAIETTDIGIDLKLIDDNKKELWAVSTSKSRTNSNLTSSSIADQISDHQIKIVSF